MASMLPGLIGAGLQGYQAKQQETLAKKMIEQRRQDEIKEANERKEQALREHDISLIGDYLKAGDVNGANRIAKKYGLPEFNPAPDYGKAGELLSKDPSGQLAQASLRGQSQSAPQQSQSQWGAQPPLATFGGGATDQPTAAGLPTDGIDWNAVREAQGQKGQVTEQQALAQILRVASTGGAQAAKPLIEQFSYFPSVASLKAQWPDQTVTERGQAGVQGRFDSGLELRKTLAKYMIARNAWKDAVATRKDEDYSRWKVADLAYRMAKEGIDLGDVPMPDFPDPEHYTGDPNAYIDAIENGGNTPAPKPRKAAPNVLASPVPMVGSGQVSKGGALPPFGFDISGLITKAKAEAFNKESDRRLRNQNVTADNARADAALADKRKKDAEKVKKRNLYRAGDTALAAGVKLSENERQNARAIGFSTQSIIREPQVYRAFLKVGKYLATDSSGDTAVTKAGKARVKEINARNLAGSRGQEYVKPVYVSQFKPTTEKNLAEVARQTTKSRQQFVAAIRAKHKGYDARQLGLIYDAARR